MREAAGIELGEIWRAAQAKCCAQDSCSGLCGDETAQMLADKDVEGRTDLTSGPVDV